MKDMFRKKKIRWFLCFILTFAQILPSAAGTAATDGKSDDSIEFSEEIAAQEKQMVENFLETNADLAVNTDEISDTESISADTDGASGKEESSYSVDGRLSEEESLKIIDEMREILMERSSESEKSDTDISWYTADGTQFELTTAAQLKGLAGLVSEGESFQAKTIILGTDIDMTGIEWSLPIGIDDERSFAGNFAGNNHTISNFFVGTEEIPASFTYTGFFGYLKGNVTDLTIQGSIIAHKSAGNLYAGGLAGFADDALFRDVTVETNVSVSADTGDAFIYAGGIAGAFYMTAESTAKTGCQNVKTAAYNCSYSGKLEVSGGDGNDTTEGAVGGIFGKLSDGTIYNCYCLEDIEIIGLGTSAGKMVGKTEGDTELINCYISGSIRRENEEAGFTGIAIGEAGEGLLQNIFYSAEFASVCGAGNPEMNRVEQRDYADGDQTHGEADLTVKNADTADMDNDNSCKAVDLLNRWAAENYRDLGFSFDKWNVTKSGQPVFGDPISGPGALQMQVDSTEVGYVAGQPVEERQPLKVSVFIDEQESGGEFTYQWYQCSSSDRSGAKAIESAESDAWQPSAEDSGVYYYYLKAVYTADEDSGYDIRQVSAESDVITVTIGYMLYFYGDEDQSADPQISTGPVAAGTATKMPQGWKRTGKIFTGWKYTAENDGDVEEVIYQPFQEYVVDESDLGRDGAVSFFAQWRDAEIYEYTLEGGQGSDKVDSDESRYTGQMYEGETFSVPSVSGYFVNAGYKFNGWKIFCSDGSSVKDENGSEKIFQSGDLYAPEGDFSLQAQWSKASQISYEKCVGDSEFASSIIGYTPAEGLHAAGDVILLPDAENLALEGYMFIGWYDAVYDRTRAAGEEYTVPSWDTVLYAQWAKKCILTFTAEEEWAEGHPEAVAALAGASVILPDASYEAPDNESDSNAEYRWRFVCWKDESGNSYKAGSEYIVVSDMIFTASFEKVRVWSGGISGSYSDESGDGNSKESPYLIENGEQLAKLAQDVAGTGGAFQNSYEDKYFKLTADIDLGGNSWMPIGVLDKSDSGSGEENADSSSARSFEGYFDGDGHTIRNFVIDTDVSSGSSAAAGLFGSVESPDDKTASISNLNVEEVSVLVKQSGSGSGYAGIIVGRLSGMISNCRADGSIEAVFSGTESSELYMGGIAGAVFGGSVSDCSSGVNVSTESGKGSAEDECFAGGIAGFCSEVSVQNCTNSGQIQLNVHSSMGKAAAGGIIGHMSGGVARKCVNKGGVSAEGGNVLIAGGIAAAAEADIENCENTGAILIIASDIDAEAGKEKTEFRDSYAGGIAGYSLSSIRTSKNAGYVSIFLNFSSQNTELSSFLFSAGGIAGGAASGSIEDCCNAGIISNDTENAESRLSASGKGYVYAGGIAGITGTLERSSNDSCVPAGDGEETISYVHNWGSCSVSARENGGLECASGLLVGKCAGETVINDAYIALDNAEGSSSSGSQSSEGNFTEGSEKESGQAISKAVGDKTGLKGEEGIYGKSTELFKTGLIAYLLDGGEEKRRVWTQNNGSYPEPGQPSVNKITAVSTPDGQVKIGTRDSSADYDEIYAVSGDRIVVSAESFSDERTFKNSKIEEKRVTGGTWYFEYGIYQGMTLTGISVSYSSGKKENYAGNSFELTEDNAAEVSAVFGEGEYTILLRSWYEADPDDDYPEEPVSGNTGRPGGGGRGNGNSVKENDSDSQNNADIDPGKGEGNGLNDGSENGENGERGDGENDIAAANSAQTVMSDELSSAVLSSNLSEAEEPLKQSEDISQPLETPSESSPSSDITVQDDLETQGETDDSPTVKLFEIIRNTAESGTLTTVLILLIILIVVGGHSRYRKNKRNG